MNRLKLTFVLTLLLNSSFAFQSDSLTFKDYERAANYMAQGVNQYVYNTNIKPNWLADDNFWFLEETADAKQFYFVNASKKSKTLAFDHSKLAQRLSKVTGVEYSGDNLPFNSLEYSDNLRTIYFKVEDKVWEYQPASNRLKASKKEIKESDRSGFGSGNFRFFFGRAEVDSPDGKLEAYIKDHNLWVRDKETKEETQLTTDGIEDFGYATNNAAWTTGPNPILKWSPDSKKIATYRQDQRHVKNMYLVTTNVGSPELKSWKYALPGDSAVATLYRVVIDIPSQKVVPLKTGPEPRRSSLIDNITDGRNLADLEWAADSKAFAFVSTSRDHKIVKVRIADAETGEIREVFEEVVDTQFEAGVSSINWRYFSETNEILWYSERDNWGHLYLYDALSGRLKNQVTKGEFVVGRVLDIDEKNRKVLFTSYGRDAKNPYYIWYNTVKFDGSEFTDLTPATGNHSIAWSPSKKYLIDTYSEPNIPPTFDLRDDKGNFIVNLGKADISKLEKETDWTPATPVKMLAADGKTDIYGLVFTPKNFEPGKKYPVVNYIYPGPQGGTIGNWAFSPVMSDHRALAELGFIVVLIEGTGNPKRAKSIRDSNYGNMAENTLPDQITGIKQLAAHYPIDLDRVGVWGHSGGGFATASAMFKYPDFYKVGVSQAGNHDNRNYADSWAERYVGLAENNNYDIQANQTHAKNLKGKLMLVHGMMDDNVPPYNTLLVVEALQKANKDFDLVLFPSARHGFGEYNNYMIRLRWDYFVRHLAGKTPPKEFNLTEYLSKFSRR